MKYRMHVKGHDIIVGTMVEGPAPGLVHIVDIIVSVCDIKWAKEIK